MFWSSMRCWVTTLMDWGISFKYAAALPTVAWVLL